ncbi:hypothetical protein DLJ59_00360 [Micromonospora inaquosa]|uniref:Uncharacterized protein n=1 Tax=Micromonospora inaquosa TaxID=2203716 RepID=A0A3N9XBV6_9ACTN|nr:hypothetical protein DLJ59_00360 [Micromonospora inaquosa]
MCSHFVFCGYVRPWHRVARDADGTLPVRWLMPRGPSTSPSRSSTRCPACPPPPAAPAWSALADPLAD